MRIVVALGGNALLRRGEKPDASVQIEHVRAAAEALAPLARQHQLIICHGNGPQVGMLSLESENDPALSRPYPMDVLVAQAQGMIGYWLAQCLRNAGVTGPVLSLVTQTVVDPADPAFATPTKFVGPVYSPLRAKELAEQHGWAIAADGERWRRVVPSPEPQRIIEQDSITRLLAQHAVVICGGGGGAPVTADSAGRLTGVEAVVDKDATAALLAIAVGADRLLVLTDVPAVMAHFGAPPRPRSCAAWTSTSWPRCVSRPARWVRRSTPAAASSPPPATPPRSAPAEHAEFVRQIMDRVGDKWTLMVIATLQDRRMRYTELLHAIPGISQRMLSRTLSQLHQDGLITRTAYAEVPPRVEYALAR